MVGRIVEITTTAQFQEARRSAGNRLVVVDFTATWCGPCKAIAPRYAELSEQNQNVVFLKVDVDRNQPLARQFQVSSIPTFLFFVGEAKVAEMRGAQPAQLVALVDQWSKHAAAADPSTSGPIGAPGAGGAASASSSSSSTPMASVPGFNDITGLIDKKQSHCLNQSVAQTLQKLLEGSAPLQSDADEQLLIHLAFGQAVKVHSIRITGPAEPSSPRDVRIFANAVSSLDFDNAESQPAEQDITLSAASIVKGDLIPLKFVKFQRVNSLTIFVKSNHGADVTRISDLRIIGLPLDAPVDVKNLKKQQDD